VKREPRKRISKAPPGEQTNHVTEVQLGGGKRSARLRVVQPVQLPPDWEMQPGVPRTRADCVNGPRPCPYVSCSHHLWLRLQSEQPGNPKAGKQGATTLRPSSPHSCALDVAEKGATIEQIAGILGMHHSRVRQIAEGALAKLFAVDPDLAAKLLEAL
jgi:hypothetical protein